MIDIFILIALIAVIIGSYTDIKTLEVPDWLNFSLVAIGIGGNLIKSIVFSDFSYIFHSLLGFGIAVLFGVLMFYTGQWGGGDSKMLFGLGALLGIPWPPQINFFIKFIVNMMVAGAIYGLSWIFALAIKHRKKVNKEFQKNRKLNLISGFSAIFLILLIYFIDFFAPYRPIFIGTILVLYSMTHLTYMVKAVEKVAMIKKILPEKLTEGDWIVDDIKVDGKIIAGPKDLGVKREQIEKLIALKKENKISTVKVKYGMPFVPSFLIGLIYTIIFDNIVFFLFI